MFQRGGTMITPVIRTAVVQPPTSINVRLSVLAFWARTDRAMSLFCAPIRMRAVACVSVMLSTRTLASDTNILTTPSWPVQVPTCFADTYRLIISDVQRLSGTMQTDVLRHSLNPDRESVQVNRVIYILLFDSCFSFLVEIICVKWFVTWKSIGIVVLESYRHCSIVNLLQKVLYYSKL